MTKSGAARPSPLFSIPRGANGVPQPFALSARWESDDVSVILPCALAGGARRPGPIAHTFVSFLRARIESHKMRNRLKLCMLPGLLLLAGCPSRRPADVKPVSLGIFEVVDCKATSAAPVSLKGSTEKYCLAAKPIVDETDVRHAQADRNDAGRSRLVLFFTLKTGQRMKENTERIFEQHGMMGLVIDGALVSVPTLSGPISDTLEVDGAFSREEAAQIAESLNAVRSRSSSSSEQK